MSDKDKYYKWLLGSAIIFFAVILLILSCEKLFSMRMDGLDLAIIFQSIWQTAHGKILASSIHPPSYIGDHWTPILLILAPFVRIWSHPALLLLIQSIILALSAWPVWLLAKNLFSSKISFWCAIIYLFNPLLWNAGIFEFHAESFLPLIGLWCVYFFVKKNWRWWIIFSVLVLFVREDASFFVAALGLVAAVERRSWHWWIAAWSMSIAYFISSYYLISQINASGIYKYGVYYQWMGDSLSEMIKFVLQSPFVVISHFFALGNIEMTLGLLLPFLFLPLFSRRFLFLILFPFVQFALTNGGGGGLVVVTHYSLLFIPGLTICALYGLNNLSLHKFSNFFGIIVHEKKLICLIVGVWVVVVTFALGPAQVVFTQNNEKETPLPVEQIRPLLQMVPKGIGVAATYGFLPFLADRNSLVNWHYIVLGTQQFAREKYDLPDDTQVLLLDTQEYLIYELQAKKKPEEQKALRESAQKLRNLLADRELSACKKTDTVVLFSRFCEKPLELYRVTLLKNPLPSINDTRDFYVADEISGIEKKDENYVFHLQLRIVPRQASSEPIAMQFLAIGDGDKTFYQRDIPLGYGLYPSSDWQGGQEVNLWYDLWLPKDVAEKSKKYNLHFFIQKGDVFLNPMGSISRKVSREFLSSPLQLHLEAWNQ